MKKFVLILLALVPITLAAQNAYVSAPLVKAMESGKFYIKLSGSQTVEESDWANKDVALSVELASKGGVSMSRSHTSVMDVVSLTTAQGTYLLNESDKTWSFRPGAGSFTGGKMKFVRQGSCKLNGQEGWYFDEYRAADGSTFTFYYNSNKVYRILVTDPSRYDRYYMFEKESGLLFLIKELETQGDDVMTSDIHVDWRAYHEYMPFGRSILPSVESYQKGPSITIIHHSYSYLPVDTTIFNRDKR